jgi:hypothetical protein
MSQRQAVTLLFIASMRYEALVTGLVCQGGGIGSLRDRCDRECPIPVVFPAPGQRCVFYNRLIAVRNSSPKRISKSRLVDMRKDNAISRQFSPLYANIFSRIIVENSISRVIVRPRCSSFSSRNKTPQEVWKTNPVWAPIESGFVNYPFRGYPALSFT